MSKDAIVGSIVAPRQLVSVCGDAVPIPDPDRVVHLQFRRFAGCPILASAGIREVVVFHSTDQELRRYVDDLPFAVAPVLVPMVRQDIGRIRAHKPLTNLHPTGGHLGLPADFLSARTAVS